MAAEIFAEIEKDPKKYYGDNDTIFKAVKELSGIFSPDDIEKKVISILQTLSK